MIADEFLDLQKPMLELSLMDNNISESPPNNYCIKMNNICVHYPMEEEPGSQGPSTVPRSQYL